jgi:hypothetical protein
MPRVAVQRLPDNARAWVFAAERRLSETQRDRLLTEVDQFLDGWTAHGVPLTSGRELRYEQFLLVGVDEAAAGASGCSIDALVRTIKRLGHELGISLIEHGPVFYREGDAVVRVTRDDFAERAARGEVTRDTLVFDNTVTSIGQVRAGRWEARAGETWHARAFF